jgi:nitrogenase subunit NifH
MLNKSFARHRAFQDALGRFSYTIFVIPQDAKIAECQIAHKTLYDYAPRAKSIPAFQELTSAIL